MLKKRDHVHEKKVLKLLPYYDRLGIIPEDHDTTEPSVQIPTELLIPGVGPHVIRYFRETPKAKAHLDEEVLKQMHAKVDWTYSSETDLRILCTLKKDDEDVSRQKKDWDTKIKQSIQFLLTTIKIEKRRCLREIWTDTCDEVRRVKTVNQLVIIIENDAESTLCIVGSSKDVNTIYGQVDKICTQLEQKRSHITEKYEVNGTERSIFEKVGMMAKLKKDHPKLTLHLNKDEIEFEGPPHEILKAQKALNSFFKNMEKRNLILTKGQKIILAALKQKKDSYIENSLKKLTAVLHEEGDILTLFGLEEDIETYEGTITKHILETHIQITDEEQTAMKDNIWIHFSGRLQEQCNGILYLKYLENKSAINLVALDKDFHIALEEIKNHIRNHAIRQDFLDLGETENKLIGQSMKDELQRIEKDFGSYGIRINPNGDSGFHITGVIDGLKQAKIRIKKLKERIISDKHTITTPGMLSYFSQQEAGRSFMKTQEDTHQVVIQIENAMSTTEHVKATQKIKSSQQPSEIELEEATHSTGVTVKVFAGDLTAFKGDAIVNAANSGLKHAGGLAKVIIEKGELVCSVKKTISW